MNENLITNKLKKERMMNKILFLVIAGLLITTALNAQFMESGEIVFEVKTSVKKTMGNSSWAERMKDKLPNFKTAYYKYSFINNTSLFQFDHWENKDAIPEFLRQSDEKTIWTGDLNTRSFKKQADVFGSTFSIQDSFPKIEWSLSNENRIIAGYNCRKAVGKIMDSVYVFAFYTDEINISGGPCSINGLPGMILGLTIPRLYTSWIATEVKQAQPVIKQPATSKNIFTFKTACQTLIEKTKDWGDESDPESKKWIEQMTWNMML
jgi:GLPGLI family protein